MFDDGIANSAVQPSVYACGIRGVHRARSVMKHGYTRQDVDDVEEGTDVHCDSGRNKSFVDFKRFDDGTYQIVEAVHVAHCFPHLPHLFCVLQ